MRTRSLVIAVLLALGGFACSGAESREPDEAPAAEASQDIVLYVSDDKLLAGSFTRDGASLEFEIERTAEGHVASFRRVDGSLLLRSVLSGGTERLELAGGVTFEGADGSLFGGTAPRWDAIAVTGDLTAVAELATDRDFSLIQKLPEALSERQDVDLSVLPTLDFDASAAGEAGDMGAFPSLQAQSHDPEGCAVCHTACVGLVALCVGTTWGVFSWICIAPGIACHAGCAGSACQ